MKNLYLFIILTILIKTSNGQSHFECFTPVPTSLKSATCNDWNNYAAVDPNNTPCWCAIVSRSKSKKTTRCNAGAGATGMKH
jgi:hypothetical protein